MEEINWNILGPHYKIKFTIPIINMSKYNIQNDPEIRQLMENEIPPPPKPPLSRLITEGTNGTCPECKSTEIKRFVFFGQSIGCIHPECSKYYKKK